MHVMDKQEFMKWTRVSDTHEGASRTAGQHSWSQGQVDGGWEEAREAHRSQTRARVKPKISFIH